MSRPPFKILLALLIALPLQVLAGELFRWTDDEGNVHYTDRIPPKYVEQGYRVISEQGLTIKTIGAKKDEPKPAEDENHQKELEALIKRDKPLLNTYSDESEIIMIRDRRIEDIKAVITLRQESIYLLEKEFIEQARQASDYEKLGQPIPSELQDEIAATERKINAYQNTIKEQQQKLIEVKDQYADELERYRNIVKILKEK